MNRILLMVLRNFWRVPGAYWKLCRYARHPERYSEEEMYAHIRYILDMAVKSGNIDFVVTGQENIPQQDGFMFYANHQGMFDVLAIASACERPLAVVLKKELQNIPFLKQVIACTKSFAMDRADIKQSMQVMIDVAKEVKKGRNYLIFPEGTRSRKGNEMVEFHWGSFKPAVRSKCTIVPFALVDSFKVLDEKGCKPVRVQLHFLEPIPYEEYKDMKTVEIAELVQGRIREKIEACTTV